MKKNFIRRFAILLVVLLILLVCNKSNKLGVPRKEFTPIAEGTEAKDYKKIKSNTNSDCELVYNASKTLLENIDILNKLLESNYDKSLTVSTTEEYSKIAPSDWILILKDNRVGIDIATWKYEYDANSDDSKYMDAILYTFIFLCGEEMGNSLWSLTGDLLDGGADETQYGFEHDGSQAVFKNGNVATYEADNTGTVYIWLTPSEYWR